MTARDSRYAPRRWRFLVIAAVLLGVYALGYSGVMRVVEHEREDHEAQNLRISEAAVEAIRQRIERSLEAALTLQVIARHDYMHMLREGHSPSSVLGRHLQEVASTERLDVLQVAIIDSSGQLAWSTSRPLSDVDLSDREHFRLHRDGRREPYISAPLLGRASGRWSVQVTQPFLDEGGNFLGVGVVSLDPLAIGAGLGALDFGPGAVATLLRNDGTVLARSRDATSAIGRKTGTTNWDLITGRVQSSARINSSLDGRPLLAAWQHLPRWGIIVVFGLDYEPVEQAAAWQRQVLTFALFSLMAGIAAGLLLVFAFLDGNRARFDAATAREASALLAAMPGRAYRGTITSDGAFQSLLTYTRADDVACWPEEAAPDQPGCERAARAEPSADGRAAFFRMVHAKSEAIREFQIKSDTGESLWVREHCRVIGTAVPSESAEVVGLIIDITEERKIKAQAISAAKLATLGEMATGVAHELNQPCASITLAADVASFELERGAPEDLVSARQRLEDIAAQTARLREVIDHFQIFSRTPDGRLGPVSLAEALSGALKISNGTLNATGISVTIDLPSSLPLVRAELVPLEQVLVNLFVNARDAMRGATGRPKRIEIAGMYDAKESQVTLTVRDHGRGLPVCGAERLFEPFFTTKPPGEGTGLGLAIAYATVRGFGGAINIANHPDGGAVVTISLKLQADGVRDEALIPAPCEVASS